MIWAVQSPWGSWRAPGPRAELKLRTEQALLWTLASPEGACPRREGPGGSPGQVTFVRRGAVLRLPGICHQQVLTGQACPGGAAQWLFPQSTHSSGGHKPTVTFTYWVHLPCCISLSFFFWLLRHIQLPPGSVLRGPYVLPGLEPDYLCKASTLTPILSLWPGRALLSSTAVSILARPSAFI